MFCTISLFAYQLKGVLATEKSAVLSAGHEPHKMMYLST